MSIVPRVCGALILVLGTSAAAADRPAKYVGLLGFDQLGEYEADLEMGGDAIAAESGDLWRLKFGYEFGRFLAAEAHYGFSNSNNGNVREGAVFGRFQLPFERVDVYLLAGAGRVGFRDGLYGPAGGVGIDLYGTERTALTLEYVHYELTEGDGVPDPDDADSDLDLEYSAVTLGLTHHFDWPSFRSQ